MAKFVDAAGREWVLTLTAADLKRVRERTGIDLAALAKDPERFIDVMFLNAHELGPVVWRWPSGRPPGWGSRSPRPTSSTPSTARPWTRP